MPERDRVIAFHGLGTMGYPMAARLAEAGHRVVPIDARVDIITRWRSEHAAHEEEAARADVITTCVTDEAAVHELLLGATGLIRCATTGQLFVDHTTTSPDFAQAAAAAAQARGAMFVDAPLSGGAAAALQGTLSVFAGGAPAALEQARTLVACYATRFTALGPAGSGQLGKLANQIAIAGNVTGLAEAVRLGRAGGLDIAALLDALAAGSARSNQLDQHREKLVDPGFRFEQAFAWLTKDLLLAQTAGQALDAELPQTSLTRQLLDRQ